MVMVYDDSDDVTFVWGDDKLAQFVAKQNSPAVREARENRQKLRALDRSGEAFHLPFSQMETETFPDGTT